MPAPLVPPLASMSSPLASMSERNTSRFRRNTTDPSSLEAHASQDRARTGSTGEVRGTVRQSVRRRCRFRWAFCSGVSLTFCCLPPAPPGPPVDLLSLRFFLAPARAAAATAKVRALSRLRSRLVFLPERFDFEGFCSAASVVFRSASAVSKLASSAPSSDSAATGASSSSSLPCLLLSDDRILLSHPPMPCGTFSPPFSCFGCPCGCCC
mmetsp:Transcript_50192/g.106892  ORF Transcript_50192/g.106892 Transcript_50192/m.106892 type:complete len:210 (-) Transcript_50192:918-1547(-)